ncbi:PAS domain-containing protein [Halomonas cerina]|uniref:PAS domain S-box-containing protein n=1 Tax=Halomonas cerina TaxID=447424 RepID=A0A839V7P2_9GAMM|nr:PAS domain S-box protein [Halomonas cerina]MBB3190000.1 PAS domain S-box-containing protein [Halomonas cerina]
MASEPLPGLAQALIEQSPEFVIFSDDSGIIQVWNGAAERTFGFSKDEAVEKSLDIIIPESLREAHWRGFARAIAEGATQYSGKSLPTKALRSDGARIYVEFGFSIVLDAKGRVLGALATGRDITERFEKERANRKRLQELEKLVE